MATKTTATKIFLEKEEYMKAAHHKALEHNLFVGYALSHKAPFRIYTPYDPSNRSSAYSSQTAYNRLKKVREVATKLRGPDYDVASKPLDHELVMIPGKEKKHGKEAICLLKEKLIEVIQQVEEERLEERRLAAEEREKERVKERGMATEERVEKS
ncbi:hypothetical protein D1007_36797 [Hordeum vulgare]|nr:hypothetical protein D1007_36797 [Hordeum vulgare]